MNVTFYNSPLNKLKSGTKNETVVTLKLFSNFAGDSIDEVNFPHKLLLTNTQFSNIWNVFENGLSVNMNFSNLGEEYIYKFLQNPLGI